MDRAVSSTLSYTLTLSIAALLVTGLLIAGGGFVNDQRQSVIREELRVIGEQVAADITRMDRLARAGSDVSALTLRQAYPERVAGTGYDITVEYSGGAGTLTLTSADPSVSTTVGFETQTSLSDATVDGGEIRFVYDPGADTLEVEDG